MSKKKGRSGPEAPANTAADKPATLKDLLGEDTLAKLKAQANELKKEEERRQEEARIRKEEARRAEQKRLENDFEHLLNTSEQDWHKYK
ncbi:YqkE family protein [Paenibacillus sp. MBLB2552]|uniref:YqkE family protein n=1 Tax=Paenibacillus mellifer TaxID=2937794 RepID=A0A9X2BPR9_9BACL|nr:YqkE family protein [Paenibacillus mellifer]MCK8487157.1 YqkE family protein [Paenibacillus mellifer]